MEEKNKKTNQDEILVKEVGGQFRVLGKSLKDKKITPSKSQPSVSASLDSYLITANKIIKQLNLNLTDEILARRLKNIILTALKKIRTEVQSRDALIKEKEIGGLGLSEEQADQVLALIKKEGAVSSPVKKELVKRAKPEKTVKKFTAQELEHELAPPPPVAQVKVKEKKVYPQEVKEKIAFAKEVKPVGIKPQKISPGPAKPERRFPPKAKPFVSQPLKPSAQKKKGLLSLFKKKEDKAESATAEVKPKVMTPSSREKITDIKVPRRLTGPVEELQNFRLVDFRQLNPNPEQAILKIKEKIDLLEGESFTKRLTGIEAWKKSEVNRLYLALGQAGLEGGKSIDQIIAARSSNNQPTLTKEEFLALGKLNKMLEY